MKIQVGKRYVTRDGRVTGKVKSNDTDFIRERYPFAVELDGDGLDITEEGYFIEKHSPSEYDLIKEHRPSFCNPNRIWSILFIALCMLIGGAINSLIYEHERMEWREAKQVEWHERMSAVEHTQRQADSLLNEAREVAREINKK